MHAGTVCCQLIQRGGVLQFFFLVHVQTAKLLTGVSEAQSQVSVDLVRKVWFPIGSAVYTRIKCFFRSWSVWKTLSP